MATAAASRPFTEHRLPFASPVRDPNAEFELLLASCASTWCPAAREQVSSILSFPLDWDRLLELAEQHGLIPLLFTTLSEHPGCAGSPNIGELTLQYKLSASRALWFTHELQRILTELRSAGIEALAHKGPALAHLLYGDVTQRQFRDLDILVRPADVARAKSVLARLGYQSGNQLSVAEERAYVKSGYEHVFHSADGRNLLELQWRILPRFYSVDFDISGMFARSIRVTLGEVPCQTLSPEDLLLALCVHAAKHSWKQLSWVYDLTQLVETFDVDWEFVAEEAKHLGVTRILALNFCVADQLFKTGLPPLLEHVARDDRIVAILAGKVVSGMRNNLCDSTESFEYFRWEMTLRERWFDRARFFWRLASTPGIGEWQSITLPSFMFPLYRGVRVWRLARRLAGL